MVGLVVGVGVLVGVGVVDGVGVAIVWISVIVGEAEIEPPHAVRRRIEM